MLASGLEQRHRHEMVLESASRANFGRFMEHFSGRGRLQRSRAQDRPRTSPKPKQNLDSSFLIEVLYRNVVVLWEGTSNF